MKALTKFALMMAVVLLVAAWLLATKSDADRRTAFCLLLLGACCSVATAIGYEVQP